MNLVEQLVEAVAKQRKRIVVIGDVMLDQYVHGHMSDCQDNCPKFVLEKVVEVPGGAANAERCLSNWDCNRSLYGYAQNDCPIKRRYIADGKTILRVDDDGLMERGKDYEWARSLAHEMVKSAAGVLISDYDKGFLTDGFINDIIGKCRHHGTPCVADVKREPKVYFGAILKCNADYQHRHNDALAEMVFREKSVWSERLVVTTGECNPLIWDNGPPQVLGYDLPPVKCVNHVGAGDCFAAHLTLALAYGFSLKDAAALAHSAGRVYVQFAHNRPPTPMEIAMDMSTAK